MHAYPFHISTLSSLSNLTMNGDQVLINLISFYKQLQKFNYEYILVHGNQMDEICCSTETAEKVENHLYVSLVFIVLCESYNKVSLWGLDHYSTP